jgi:hypothetical protein
MIGAAFLGVAIAIYVLLAVGLPLGDFALGGKYKVLPPKYRIICVIVIILQLFFILILLQTGGVLPLIFSRKVTKGICIFFAVYISLNVIMNSFSNSKKERYVATPLSMVAAVCFWITIIGS